MSNARMTFRFGENESDKPNYKEEKVVGAFPSLTDEISQSSARMDSTPSWTPENIPGDWGEITLPGTSLLESESDQKKDKNSELMQPQYVYSDRVIDPGENERELTDDSSYEGHDWMADRDHYSYKRNRPPRGWKMIGSVTGALVTGALFGMVILSFFNREGTDPGVLPQTNQPVSSVTGVQGAAGTEQQVQSVLNGGSYYALQYGVFSSPERAEQAKLELSQAGIAAGTDPDDGNRVYAGISADREEAKLLSSRLKSEGVELYVKEIAYPAVNSAALGMNQEDVQLFFSSSATLVEQLSTLSIGQLGQVTPEPVPAETMTTLQNQHQSWLTGVGKLSAEVGQEAEPIVSAMKKSMNSAITAVAEYNKNPSNVHMWSVQSDLMDYVLQQKKWLEGIKQ
ncbi:SPOR domain-containing protein [Paenibacillus xylanilyticus]|uniref:SPOR domain-containing protein n=1 Tax=Paenibacillus xylanilyticus TaxID=248903 RepID=A0A7Y6BUP0_9BACL|nr:SPOR domain-containing protein [Paenibacillus xylanilyticus]NUU74480.1 SPOR domain-containing protein [Paenibacillus xylanilyticus]